MLHQLRAHFFLTLLLKFHLIRDKGSIVNNLLNLARHFHRVTVGFRSGPSRCHGFFQTS